MKTLKTNVYLKQRREELGIPQKDVAKRLKLNSAQYISNIERGICGPSIPALKVMSDLYKLNSRDLIEMLTRDYREFLSKKLKSR